MSSEAETKNLRAGAGDSSGAEVREQGARAVEAALADKTTAQQLLERMMGLRAKLLAAAIAQEKALYSIRGGAGQALRPQLELRPSNNAITAFFPAADAVMAELEAIAARIEGHANEAAGHF